MSYESQRLDEERDQVARERKEEPSDMRRFTEQGDELTETHSLAQRENRPQSPYRPPRQPAQDPPD